LYRVKNYRESLKYLVIACQDLNGKELAVATKKLAKMWKQKVCIISDYF
jgi:hypothetical protein